MESLQGANMNSSVASSAACITSSTSSPSILMTINNNNNHSSSQHISRCHSSHQYSTTTTTSATTTTSSHQNHSSSRSFKQFFSKLANMVKPNPAKKKKKKKKENSTTSSSSGCSSPSSSSFETLKHVSSPTHGVAISNLPSMNDECFMSMASSSYHHHPPSQQQISNFPSHPTHHQPSQQPFMFSSVIAKTRDSRTRAKNTSSTSLPDNCCTTTTTTLGGISCSNHSPLTNMTTATALSTSPRMIGHTHTKNHSSSTILFNEEQVSSDLDLDWDDVVEDLEKFSSFTMTMDDKENVVLDHRHQQTELNEEERQPHSSVQQNKHSKRRHTTHFSSKSYHHSAFSSQPSLANKLPNNCSRSKRESSKSENRIKDQDDLDTMVDLMWITDGPTTTSTTMETVNRKKNPSLLSVVDSCDISVDTNKNGNNSASFVHIKSTSASNLYSSLSTQDFEDFSFSPGCNFQTSSSIIAL
ncbi:hypothetical protein C9374_011182 [Naegleria lovaniensis]|uniref:Uncharacterized protein n=1 Tax=Naegleria lovaniensis TaxID=51637 RepID=A0AA88KDG1_NAELO|nr:uncharacterized protein C9374_011182 [Naegleria lovaniensis]KAG2374103.1 hypothetical protein C9374_011182 [Naegleria lovaniensis]